MIISIIFKDQIYYLKGRMSRIFFTNIKDGYALSQLVLIFNLLIKIIQYCYKTMDKAKNFLS